MQKILVAYYSRTGTTRKVAGLIAGKLGAELEEIRSAVKLDGIKGYLIAGRDATGRRLTPIEPSQIDQSVYDLVIIGTPVWSWNVSSVVRAYLTEQKAKFKAVAFFCTMGGSGDERAFREMGEIVGHAPRATLSLTTKEVVKGEVEPKVSAFVQNLS